MEIMKIGFRMDMMMATLGVTTALTSLQWAQYATLDNEKKQMTSELLVLMQNDGDLL
jgi:hypothetical protein